MMVVPSALLHLKKGGSIKRKNKTKKMNSFLFKYSNKIGNQNASAKGESSFPKPKNRFWK